MSKSPDGTLTISPDASAVRTLTTATGLDFARRVQIVVGDSSAATAATWTTLASTLRSVVDATPHTPVLITHGSDTLAWSAGMLAVSGPWDVPIAVTGASQPAGILGSDAEANTLAALAVARNAPPGVYLVFRDHNSVAVHQGGYARKGGSSRAPFISLGGRFGTVVGPALTFGRPLRPSLFVAPATFFDRPVVTLTVSPTFDDRPFDPSTFQPGAAVALELYGCATAPPAAIRFVERCTEAGVPVHTCPPAPRDSSAAYVSQRELVSAGAEHHPEATLELLVPFLAAHARPE